MAQLGKILGQQRIGRRNRAVRNTGIHRPQRHLQMLNIVARQDRQRTLCPQAIAQQALCNGANVFQHLGIADATPLAISVPCSDKGVPGPDLRPVHQAIKQAFGHRLQGFQGAHVQDAADLQHFDRRVTDGHLAITWRRCRGLGRGIEFETHVMLLHQGMRCPSDT